MDPYQNENDAFRHQQASGPVPDDVSRRSFLQRVSGVISASIAAKLATAQNAAAPTPPQDEALSKPSKSESGAFDKPGTLITTFMYDASGRHTATVIPVPIKEDNGPR